MRISGLVCTVALCAAVPIQVARGTISIVPVNTPFMDISGSSTVLLPNGDDMEWTIPASEISAGGFTGNALFAGGQSVRVGNNGGIIWNPIGDMEIGWDNANLLTMLPSNSSMSGNGLGVRQFITPLWDDYFPLDNGDTSVHWAVMNGDLIVQWIQESHFLEPGTGVVTFQAKFHGGANGPFATFVYNDTFFSPDTGLNDSGSATIGYKNWQTVPWANDAQWSFNQEGAVTGYIQNGGGAGPHALAIVPEPAFACIIGLALLARARRRQ